jgi:hypothetical protein
MYDKKAYYHLFPCLQRCMGQQHFIILVFLAQREKFSSIPGQTLYCTKAYAGSGLVVPYSSYKRELPVRIPAGRTIKTFSPSPLFRCYLTD